MRRSYLVIAALLVPLSASAIIGNFRSTAPERAIKFLEVRFAEPQSWSCTRLDAATDEAPPTGGPEDTCLACSNDGAAGSTEITVSRAPDGAEETLTTTTKADICGDVVMVKSGDSTAPREDPVGEAPEAVDGGERPVDSGMSATSG